MNDQTLFVTHAILLLGVFAILVLQIRHIQEHR